MKKIVAFTAIRSEYDLLSSLYKLLNNDENIDLRLIASGAHLSKTYGYSVKDIEADGLNILAKIETLLDSDTRASRIKSASILLQSSIDVIANYNPELIIFAGDREEVMVASLIGGYLEIPTIHFFGGDHVEDSHVDNPVRHAASKLSSVHFVSTLEHKKRLIAMGEKEKRIFNIGSIALDKFKSEEIFSKKEIFKRFNVKKEFEKFAIVIFHPIPIERDKSAQIFENILIALRSKGISAFVSYPNIDPGNKEIIEVIEKYRGDNNFIFYKNQPRKMFLSIYKNAEFIIGNSSSGVLESASIPIGAINVGHRQTGRRSNENLFFIDSSLEKIQETIDIVTSESFKEKLKFVSNIYGDGNSAQKAYELIINTNFKDYIFKDEDALRLKWIKF